MNYIHVHEKCLKCGECRLECEHRTKWTSASTSTSPNTESDKSIDEILIEFGGLSAYEWANGSGRGVHYFMDYDGQQCEYDEEFKSAKDQLFALLMDVIGEDEFDQQELNETENGSEVPFLVRNGLRAEQRQKLKELFGKEK